jgi:hypothetical protein
MLLVYSAISRSRRVSALIIAACAFLAASSAVQADRYCCSCPAGSRLCEKTCESPDWCGGECGAAWCGIFSKECGGCSTHYYTEQHQHCDAAEGRHSHVTFERPFENLKEIDPNTVAIKKGFAWRATSEWVSVPSGKSKTIWIKTPSPFSSYCETYANVGDETRKEHLDVSKPSTPLPQLRVEEFISTSDSKHGYASISFHNDGTDSRKVRVVLHCK